MIDILWSPRAEADLKEIRAFIETDSPAWADLTTRRLVAAVERLREEGERRCSRLLPMS